MKMNLEAILVSDELWLIVEITGRGRLSGIRNSLLIILVLHIVLLLRLKRNSRKRTLCYP